MIQIRESTDVERAMDELVREAMRPPPPEKASDLVYNQLCDLRKMAEDLRRLIIFEQATAQVLRRP